MALLSTLVLALTACTEANIAKVDSKPSAAAPNEKESPSPEASPANEIYNLGDSVQFDDLIITVNGIRESKGKLFVPDEGEIFLLVDVTAENKGSEDANVSSMLNTKVVDGDGFNHSLTIAEDGKGSFDGTVGAGRKLRGEIAYAVPKDATLEFIYSDPFKKGQAIWKLK